MNGWLLDTNVISEIRRPRPDARVVAFVATQPLETLFVSAVTFAEIRYGIETVSDPIRRTGLNDVSLISGPEALAKLKAEFR